MDIRKIIREEVEKTMNPPPEPINIDWEEGSVFGVVHFDREHLNNWIKSEKIQANFDSISDKDIFPIGILKNINVEEEYRGQGFGLDLMDSFLVECSHCSYITLIADLDEEQRENFNIVDWYKSFGFSIFGKSGKNIVMIKKADDLYEIDLSVNSNSGAKPGINLKFPEENPIGGHSLNLSVDDGPHQFPKEDDLI